MRRPGPGRADSISAAAPPCKCRSSSATWPLASRASSIAVLTAIVVAPTPPRAPHTATTCPPRPPIGSTVRSAMCGSSSRCTASRVSGLGMVLGDAEFADQHPVEADLGAVADHQHLQVRRAELGEVLQRRRRLRHARDIDDRDLRRLPLEEADGLAHGAAPDVEVRRRAHQAEPQRVGGFVVAEEGDDAAVAAGGLARRRRRGWRRVATENPHCCLPAAARWRSRCSR